jgi:hypothetical protein
MMFLYSHHGLSVESTVNCNATDPSGHLSVVQRAFPVSDGVDPETYSHLRNLRNGSSV